MEKRLSIALLLLLLPFASSVRIANSERAALNEVISGFAGNLPSSWNYNYNCSSWKGFECDEDGFVVELNFYNFNLNGGLNSAIGKLPKLKSLAVSGNSFTGKIPASIANLNLTNLDLSYNKYGGEIPSFLGNIKYLNSLSLQNNIFVGKIPSSLGNLKYLETLNLASNNLVGEIVSALGNLKKLELLDLGLNKLSGKIPSFLGNLKNLQHLRLCCNKFTDTIPNSFINLRMLNELDVSKNQMSGKFPNFFGKMGINSLYLNKNKFYGNIPNDFYNAAFANLDLSDNLLGGPLNSKIENFFISQYLNFSNNYFTYIPNGLNDFFNGYNAFNRIEDVSGNCILSFPKDWKSPPGETQTKPKQKPSALCKAFCGSNSSKGPCAGHGFCFLKAKSPTCSCDSGYKLSKNTCVKA